MKIANKILPVCMAVALLTACRSSRHATTDAGAGTLPDAQTGATTVVPRPKAEALTAKLNLTLESGGKQINVGGNYRLKRDEVVQINLTYTMVFTISVGTLELTPDYLLLLDRINKRYCRIRYSEEPSLAQAGITFDYLQSVFWGEAGESPTKALEWAFSNWTDFEGGRLPQQIQFTLRPTSSAYKATFLLSNLRADSDWETHTEFSSKYTAVSLDTVMRALMSVAK